MTIIHIGSVTGSPSVGNSTTPLTLAIPGTYAADDFFVVFATAMDGTNNVGITANAEYTEKTDGFPALGTSGTDVNIRCFHRKLTSGADTDITLTQAVTSRLSGVGMVFRGVDGTTPFDVNPTVSTAANLGLVTASPPITPVNSNGALILVLQSGSGTSDRMSIFVAPTTPASLLEGASYYPGDRNFQDLVTAYKLDYGAAALITPSTWLNQFGGANIVNGQTQANYDNSPTTEGTFTAGTGYAVSDVITLTGGSTVTVNTLSGSAVATFTVTTGADSGGHDPGDTLSQTGVAPAGGSGFSLTLNNDNIDGGTNELAVASVALRATAGGATRVLQDLDSCAVVDGDPIQ